MLFARQGCQFASCVDNYARLCRYWSLATRRLSVFEIRLVLQFLIPQNFEIKLNKNRYQFILNQSLLSWIMRIINVNTLRLARFAMHTSQAAFVEKPEIA